MLCRYCGDLIPIRPATCSRPLAGRGLVPNINACYPSAEWCGNGERIRFVDSACGSFVERSRCYLPVPQDIGIVPSLTCRTKRSILGQVLQYRLKGHAALLWAGGMGEVYRARDTRLERTVAVKVSKKEFTERFTREAQAIATHNHPNVCTLHDVGPNYLGNGVR